MKIENVSKKYTRHSQSTMVLDNVTLDFPRGDFACIVGPSGIGKSTLLLMLGGMLSPSAGRVLLNNQSLYDLPSDQRAHLRRKEMGFVFQSFNLVTYLSALENVQVPLFLAGVNHGAQRDKAAALLERVGLADKLDHKPSELSIGQQQRVALARALANDPAIIFADEPTGNLDADTGQEIMAFFQELNREGRTIIMVTHDLRLTARAKRTLRLANGGVSVESQTREGDIHA